MILFIYNSVKCKLIYSDRKQVSGDRKQVVWGQGLERDGLQKGQKEIFEMMKIFVMLIVMLISRFRYTSELFSIFYI